MKKTMLYTKHLSLSLGNTKDHEKIIKVSKALSSPERLMVLNAILFKSQSVTELVSATGLPFSSVARHIETLAKAELISINYQPGIKGHAKYCAQSILSYKVELEPLHNATSSTPVYSVELPVGQYSHCHIKAPCGINGKDSPIAKCDQPNDFFIPERINAEHLWFDKGFISYNFPAPTENNDYSEISFSFEICSETMYFNNIWPSDITVHINNIEILTFTSPGDFGGRRGYLTPEYWPLNSTQFGLLKKIKVNSSGCFIDNLLVNRNITFEDLKVFDGSAIKLTIGIKDDAVHKGGINLFGKNFGDFPQGIIMKIR